MNISFKNVIFSFVVGLLIFSFIMAVVCAVIFDSQIKVASEPNIYQHSEKAEIDRSVIFKCVDGEKLELAVLTQLDEKHGKIYLTPLFGDYLMSYQGANSYLSTVYASCGDKSLCELVKAFCGVFVSTEDVFDIDISTSFSDFKNNFIDGFKGDTAEFEQIFGCDKSVEEFKIEELPVCIKEQNTHDGKTVSIIDNEKTLIKYKNFLK